MRSEVLGRGAIGLLLLACGCAGSAPDPTGVGGGNPPGVLPPDPETASVPMQTGLPVTGASAPAGMSPAPGATTGASTPGMTTAPGGSTGTQPPAAMGTAGMGALPTAGVGLPPDPGTTTTPPPANDGTPAPKGAKDPVVPAVSGQCPTFRNGSITFMNLSGIEIAAGAKASSPSAPMVFYWHGTGSFAGEYAGMASAVAQGVKEEGGVLVSFNGTTGGDLLSGTFIFGMSDFMLTDQLFACAVKDHNVDPRRVFATGCSAGGLFSAAMAAARSKYVAAAAPNSGGWTVPVQFQSDFTPALMTIHGAPGVDVVAVDFSVTSKTADEAFKARGGYVVNCNHGGTHCGGGSLAPEVWEFFKAHPYGVDPEPWGSSLPSGFSSACKVF